MANSYFSWLVRKVADSKQAKKYSLLFDILDEYEYLCVNLLDENRIAHVIEMRRDYEEDHNIREKDTRPVSLFEVLVNLAYLCEDRVMSDSDYGDRTSLWFWSMMDMSGLSRYDNNKFNERLVRKSIDVILLRKYKRDGSDGGLFYIPDTAKDLRKIDLWTQLMWWLTRYEEDN